MTHPDLIEQLDLEKRLHEVETAHLINTDTLEDE